MDNINSDLFILSTIIGITFLILFLCRLKTKLLKKVGFLNIKTPFQKNESENPRVETSGALLIGQVCHDICGPITAFKMLAEMNDFQYLKNKPLVENTVNRIHDLALLLLSRLQNPSTDKSNQNKRSYKNHKKNSTKKCEGFVQEHLPVILLEQIIAEKKILFKTKPGIRFVLSTKIEDFSLFSRISPIHFTSAISNLLNNSAESFLNETGIVEVSLQSRLDKILVLIQDNGPGFFNEKTKPLPDIPILSDSIYSKGFGLGIPSAKFNLKVCNSELFIEKTSSQGTLIKVELKKSLIPEWFCQHLDLSVFSKFILLSSNQIIKDLWKLRLNKLNIDFSTLEWTCIPNELVFRKWIHGVKSFDSFFFIIDSDFSYQGFSGLSFINKLNLNHQALLVFNTWHYPPLIKQLQLRKVMAIPWQGIAALSFKDPVLHKINKENSPTFSISIKV